MTMQGERILVVDIGVRGLYFAVMLKKALGESHHVEAAAVQGGVSGARLSPEFQNALRAEFGDAFDAVHWNPFNALLDELEAFTRVVVVGYDCLPLVQRLLPEDLKRTVSPMSDRDVPNPYHANANEWFGSAVTLVEEWVTKHVAPLAVA